MLLSLLFLSLLLLLSFIRCLVAVVFLVVVDVVVVLILLLFLIVAVGGGGGGGSDTVVACVCFSIHMHACKLIRGCQTPRETTPGRLRHPAPVLMTGAPGPVPVYRALKTTSRPAPVVAPRQACHHPCPRTASARLDQSTSLAQQRACPHPCPRSLDLWNTMKMSCTCGTSTVMRIRTKAIVVAHNGHDNLVQEQH